MFFRRIFYASLVVLVALSLTVPSLSHRAKAQSVSTVAILIVDDFVSPLAAVANAVNADPAAQQAVDDAVQKILTGTDSVENIINDLVAKLNEIPSGALGLDDLPNNNCAITLEGQDFYTTGGTDVGFYISGADFYTTGGTGNPAKDSAHGWLVKKELEELTMNNPYIVLVPVDISGFNTSLVKGAIEQAIRDNPADKYVINMSFAVTPCINIPSLVIYDLLMRALSPQVASDMDKLYQLFQQLVNPVLYDHQFFVPSDPLFVYLAGLSDEIDEYGKPKYVPVGAAGNGSVQYPFYPAALANVVSVSGGESFTLGLLQLASYSNYGTIMLSGDWIDSSQVVHRGTTYAAPRYSYLMAMYLIGSPVACNCNTVAPCALDPIYVDWFNAPPSSPNQPLCSP